jgi:hypothetical protein
MTKCGDNLCSNAQYPVQGDYYCGSCGAHLHRDCALNHGENVFQCRTCIQSSASSTFTAATMKKVSTGNKKQKRKTTTVEVCDLVTDIILPQVSTDPVLLVYPFIGGIKLEAAATTVKLRFGPKPVLDQPVTLEKQLQLQQDAAKGRSHFLIFKADDINRLRQGEWFNDTVIDFMMRW